MESSERACVVLLAIANTMYFLRRHESGAKKLAGDNEPSLFDLDALAFYWAPVAIFGLLFWHELVQRSGAIQ